MTEYEELSKEQLIEAVEELEKQLIEEEEKKEKWENQAKKVKADFENYKKDEENRKRKWKKEAQQKLAEDLISVLDNLERAIASADKDNQLVKGVKMVADQLYETLEKKGLERIEAEGEEFDPEIHKAIDTETHEEHNKVIEQRRKGYMYDNKVIREAEVIVGKKENIE